MWRGRQRRRRKGRWSGVVTNVARLGQVYAGATVECSVFNVAGYGIGVVVTIHMGSGGG